MRFYALMSRDCTETIDLFVRAADAYEALEAALRDEPSWRALLYVEPLARRRIAGS